MKKIYKSISAMFAMLLVALVTPAAAFAQWSWHDNFEDYGVGDELVGSGGWMQYGSQSNNPVKIVGEQLSYDGYPGGVKGKSISLTSGEPSDGLYSVCQKVYAVFNKNEDPENKVYGITSGSVYFSALIKVNAIMGNYQYFASFLTRNMSDFVDKATGAERGKIYARANTGNTGYQLGINPSAMATKTAYTSDLEYGKTYLMVVKYTINEELNGKDGMSLYINPVDFTEEPSEPTARIATGELSGGIMQNLRLGLCGLQALELRQTASSVNSGVQAELGCIRVADTWAGLFQAGAAEDAPRISAVPGNVDFGNLLQGSEIEKIVKVRGRNLTGDVSLSLPEGSDVSISSVEAPAAAVMSEEGFSLTVKLTAKDPSQKSAQIVLSSEGAEDVKVNLSWNTLPVTEVETLKDFNALEITDDRSIYRLKSGVVLTHLQTLLVDDEVEMVQLEMPAFHMQDKDGGTVFVDRYLQLATEYVRGDSIVGLIGYGAPGKLYGVEGNVWVPVDVKMGTLLSSGNVAVPVEATLAELKNSPAQYLNRLVRVSGVTVKDADSESVFTSQPMALTDDTDEVAMHLFSGSDLLGESVPMEELTVTGLFTSLKAPVLRPRDKEDITDCKPALSFDNTTFTRAEGKVGETTEVGTIHISARNLPGNITIDLTGAGAAHFSVSANTIKVGTSETDLVISYVPSAAGVHTANLLLDCPSAPELLPVSMIRLSGIAMDPQNPPVVSIDPAEIPAFPATNIGETQEQTVVVKSANLPDYGKIAFKSASGNFRISNTMILKNSGENGSVLKITFAPRTAGELKDTLLFTAYGVDTIAVKLQGTGIDPSALSETEGDELPLDATHPLTLLNETFGGAEHNKPLSIEGWKNLAVDGTCAWWGYEFPETDASAGEKVAKVTPYDSKIEVGEGTPCRMMLVTPALDFRNAASKIFTFRVRGDYLADGQSDRLELVYIALDGEEMRTSLVGGFSMPATADESGQWQEYHIDLTDLELDDVFFMGFSFTGTRGTDNAATYYIDDVSYGRTDLPVIRPSVPEVALYAAPGVDAVSEPVEVVTENLNEPVSLTLVGADKGKFTLSAATLPAEGGSFTVTFNDDEEGSYEVLVKIASRGAADKYVAVKTTCLTGMAGVQTAETDGVTVYDAAGRVVLSGTMPSQAASKLPAGVYIMKSGNKVRKIQVR